MKFNLLERPTRTFMISHNFSVGRKVELSVGNWETQSKIKDEQKLIKKILQEIE